MNTVLTTGTQISKEDFINAAQDGNAQVVQAYIDSGAGGRELNRHRRYHVLFLLLNIKKLK